MPRKKRDIRRDLRKAGFAETQGKGDHRERRRKPRAFRPGRNAPLPRGRADSHQHTTLAYRSNL
jgi:hypothetical protein